MTNEQILKKAIEQAVKNGFNWTDSIVDEVQTAPGGAWMYDQDGTGHYYPNEQIIFSHDFAKAFWGEEMMYMTIGTSGGYEMDDFYPEWTTEEVDEWYDDMPVWQYQLKKMVTETEPIKYLETFL